MLREKLGPSNCALAVGIPLTRDAFKGDREHPDRWDFAASILRENPDAGLDDAWSLYAPKAATAERVIRAVEALGVTVVREARLAHLPNLLTKFRVVTIVAHWRCLGVRADDISDVAGLLRDIRAARPPSPVVAALRWSGERLRVVRPDQQVSRVPYVLKEVFHKQCPRLLDPEFVRTEPPESLRRAVAGPIDAIVAAAHASYDRDSDADAPPTTPKSPRSPLERLHRIAFEQAFPGSLAAGKALELRDGLHSAAEVIRAVPEGFSGLIDTCLCNSTILGHAIKAIRTDGLVYVSRSRAALDVRLSLYKLVITLLSREKMPFITAYLNAKAEVDRVTR